MLVLLQVLRTLQKKKGPRKPVLALLLLLAQLPLERPLVHRTHQKRKHLGLLQVQGWAQLLLLVRLVQRQNRLNLRNRKRALLICSKLDEYEIEVMTRTRTRSLGRVRLDRQNN